MQDKLRFHMPYAPQEKYNMESFFCAASSLIARSIGFGPQAKIISASRLFSFIASITVPFVPLFPSSVAL